MSDPVLITALGVFQAITVAAITGLGAWINRVGERRAEKAEQNHRESLEATEVIRKDVNGKMAQLLNVTAEAEKAKGKLEGIAEAKSEAEGH